MAVRVQALLEELIKLLRQNRRRHGDCWRKVRMDRLGKCFPGVTDQELVDAVNLGVDRDLLVVMQKLDEGSGTHVPAVKLAHYLTGPQRVSKLAD